MGNLRETGEFIGVEGGCGSFVAAAAALIFRHKEAGFGVDGDIAAPLLPAFGSVPAATKYHSISP
jgi:hypothetical protein